jgi:hypothetical protein
VQTHLPIPLAFDQDPVVVPIRQQLSGESKFLQVELFGRRRSLDEPAPLATSLANVDSDVGRERKLRADDGDKPVARPIRAPQRRPKVRECAFFGRVDPELARDVEPLERPLAQRQEGQEPLDTERKIDRLAVTEELEAVDEMKVELAR